jgi:hypothetical protein
VEGRGSPSAWLTGMAAPLRSKIALRHREIKIAFQDQKTIGTILILPRTGPPKGHRDWENEPK